MENIKISNPWNVPNQFQIITDKGVYFQSYDSIIVFKDNNGNISLGSKWDCSRTTSKYRSKFLDETTKETRNKVYKGIYRINKDW